MVYVFALSGGNFQLLVVVQWLFSLWVIYNFVFKLGEIHFSPYGITAWWILGLVLVGNLWINNANYSVAQKSFQFAATHVVGILIFALAAQWAARNLNPERILEYLGWMLAPVAIFGIFLGWGSSNRADPFGIHPNWWGETAFGLSLCVLAVKNRNFKIFVTIIALFLMYVVQSRGAMAATLVSAFTYWILSFRPFGKTALKRLIVVLFSVAGILFFIFAMDWLSPTLTFVEDRILLLHDPYRGLGTGFTGRLYSWKESIRFFLENPFFGHGFDTFSKVHNGFLRFAAEGGIILFGMIVVMIVSAMVHAWRQRNDLVFATLLGIVGYFMSYPRALNLNVVGVVFLLSLFPWEHQQWKDRRGTL
jgi:O-antigen ligase